MYTYAYYSTTMGNDNAISENMEYIIHMATAAGLYLFVQRMFNIHMLKTLR